MTEYLVLLPSPEARYATATDQELQDLHTAHTEFVQLLAERGHKMTGGAQLTPSSTAKVVRGTALDEVTLTDGPFAESAEQVAGYYLVESDDVEDLARACGRLLSTPFHPAVEIRPTVQM
ncbi:YciI family protein [Pedococcus sp. KACC 23699]|uniref:YciI family protein n=1 Tax=Pedococcus sp. KACC 23699 TaxID=3149228 RepID=A0AAU7JXX0_9MICO